jgi:hypothetical protein
MTEIEDIIKATRVTGTKLLDDRRRRRPGEALDCPHCDPSFVCGRQAKHQINLASKDRCIKDFLKQGSSFRHRSHSTKRSFVQPRHFGAQGCHSEKPTLWL